MSFQSRKGVRSNNVVDSRACCVKPALISGLGVRPFARMDRSHSPRATRGIGNQRAMWAPLYRKVKLSLRTLIQTCISSKVNSCPRGETKILGESFKVCGVIIYFGKVNFSPGLLPITFPSPGCRNQALSRSSPRVATQRVGSVLVPFSSTNFGVILLSPQVE